MYRVLFIISIVLYINHMDSFLTFGQKAEIISLHRQCKERRFADRLKAILLLDKGLSCGQIGEILLQDDDTIRNYKKKYLSEGANPLLSDNKKEGFQNLQTNKLRNWTGISLIMYIQTPI